MSIFDIFKLLTPTQSAAPERDFVSEFCQCYTRLGRRGYLALVARGLRDEWQPHALPDLYDHLTQSDSADAIAWRICEEPRLAELAGQAWEYLGERNPRPFDLFCSDNLSDYQTITDSRRAVLDALAGGNATDPASIGILSALAEAGILE